MKKLLYICAANPIVCVMTNRQYFSRLKAIWTFALIFTAALAQGLPVRTSFFMEGSQYRLQLNPALPPDAGFVSLPFVGNAGAWENSDVLTAGDFFDMMQNVDDVDYYATDKFYAKLKDRNRITAGANDDLMAAGWWHGDNFYSVSVGVKADGHVNAPLEMFTFMRDMRGMNTNDYTDYECAMRDIEVSVNTYAEIGVGYSRIINDRLTIGGRVKGLLGLGNADFKARYLTVATQLTGLDPNLNWSTASLVDFTYARGTAQVLADARLLSSFKGLELVTNDEGYIETVRLKRRNIGVSGWGAALDAGMAYQVNNKVTLSASVTDLGFIRWSQGCTEDAYANTDDLAFDSNHPGNVMRFFSIIGRDEPINLHLLRLTPTGEHFSHTTSLAASFSLGGQYRSIDKRFGFGALYSCHAAKSKTLSEFTIGADFRPVALFDVAVSYSPILCGGQAFGVAMKLGPLFVGTDYLYLGSKAKSVNALIGLSFPIGSPRDAF